MNIKFITKKKKVDFNDKEKKQKILYLVVDTQTTTLSWSISSHGVDRIASDFSPNASDIILRMSQLDTLVQTAKARGKNLRNLIAKQIGAMPSYRKVATNLYWATPLDSKSIYGIGVTPLASTIKKYLSFKKIDKDAIVFFNLETHYLAIKIDSYLNTYFAADASESEAFQEQLSNISNGLDIFETDLNDYFLWIQNVKVVSYQIEQEVLGLPLRTLSKPLLIGSIIGIAISSVADFTTSSQLEYSQSQLSHVKRLSLIPTSEKKEFNRKYINVVQDKSKINLSKLIIDAQKIWRPNTLVSLSYGKINNNQNNRSPNGIFIHIPTEKNPFNGQRYWVQTGLTKEILDEIPPSGYKMGILLPNQEGKTYEVFFAKTK
jgi:hypothetical protein